MHHEDHIAMREQITSVPYQRLSRWFDLQNMGWMQNELLWILTNLYLPGPTGHYIALIIQLCVAVAMAYNFFASGGTQIID